jgi:hypothetical protein
MVLPLAGANLKQQGSSSTHIDVLVGFVVFHLYYYLLNLLTMKELKPTTVALFISNRFYGICYWFIRMN